MKIQLVVQNAGKATGQAIPINVSQFLIGRDPRCNLRPGSAMISKEHCAILVKNKRVYLRDFDSTNGTILNDRALKGEAEIGNGDILKVGPLIFKVVIEGQVVSSASKAQLDPEDAGALLLALTDDDRRQSTVETTTDQEAVPSGSTIMDLPSFNKNPEAAPASKTPTPAQAMSKSPTPVPPTQSESGTPAGQKPVPSAEAAAATLAATTGAAAAAAAAEAPKPVEVPKKEQIAPDARSAAEVILARYKTGRRKSSKS